MARRSGAALLVLVSAACGRVGYDPKPPPPGRDGGGEDGHEGPDGAGLDAAEPILNDTCAARITLTIGAAATSATTCGATDTFSASCNGSGVPEVWYRVVEPASGIMVMHLSAGFVALTAPSADCSTVSATCASEGTQFAASASGPQEWIFAVEQVGGGCGPFTISFQPQ